MYGRGLASRLHELTTTPFHLEETRMFGGNDPHARLFDLNNKTMKGWVMIATNALGVQYDLSGYIDIAMSFTFAMPPKTAKQTPKKQPQS